MRSEPVFLHVGLPKTGTTELQKVLWENRRRLADRGVVYPGKDRGVHYRAALDLLGSRRATEPGAWEALAARAKDSPGRVVLSHEMLAAARPEQVDRIARDLAPREVHVVVTVRDFSRIVSATWQERAKNREVEPWGPFLDAVSKGPQGNHPFWRLQDAPGVIGEWSRHVPGERIHVITVPPLQQDPLLLLRRFAEVVGFSLDDVEVSGRGANQSIGALEIAVLQRVNVAAKHLSWDRYRRLVKNHLVKDVLAQRDRQVRVVLPEQARGWVDAETARIREVVEGTGCLVVGDLAELDPKGVGVLSDRETDAPDAVSPAEALEAASEALVALAEEVERLRKDAGAQGSGRALPVATSDGLNARLRRIAGRVRHTLER
jgi:hypothetical protein